MTMKLVGQEGPDFWYEMVNESYYGKTGLRMLVDFGDRQRPESITIKAAKPKDAKGQIIDYPPAMIGLMNSTLRGQLGPIVINWNGLPQEDVSVSPESSPALTRAGPRSPSPASSRPAWSGATPPFRCRAWSAARGTTRTGELVDFGTSGARSEF